MLTLTAPSTDEHLRWSVNRDRDRLPCGCDRNASAGLGLWNASSASRWNRLRTALKREHPHMVYLRAVEVQHRGALHLHVIIWTAKPVDLQRVQVLALSAGFGCVLDYAPCAPGSRKAAYYVSKYVTKACDSRSSVPWDVVNEHTGEIESVPEGRYRTWSSSQDWGLTMKAIEHAIRAAAARRAQAMRDEPPAPVSDTPADAPEPALSG